MSLTGKTIGQLPQYTAKVTGSILFPVEYNGSTYNITQDKLTSNSSASYASTASYAITASYALYALGGSANSILYQTASAATTWSFNHFLQTQYPVFTIYDSGNNVIVPQRIQAVDSSSALIYFSSPSTGVAVASKGGYSSSVVVSATTANTAITASYALNAANAFIQNGNSFGAQAVLGTNDLQNLALKTNGSTRLFISSSGFTGIGTTTQFNTTVPPVLLDVNGLIRARNGIQTIGDITTTIISSSRSDNTFPGALLFNGWGDYAFNNSLLVGYNSITFASTPLGSGNLFVSNRIAIGKTGSSAAFDVNGNAIITGSLIVLSGITGSLSGSVTGSLFGTSSQALTASYSITSNVAYSGTGSFTGSFIGVHTGSLFGTASQALTASYLLGGGSGIAFPYSGSAQITGSLGVTGSINSTGNITTTGTLTAQTLVVQTITSSIEYSSGSNIFGSRLTDTQTMTGSVNITGSLNLAGPQTINGNLSINGFTTQIGNTLLTGSVIISGSLGQPNPTISIFGDLNQTGYTRYLPVSTNINNNISASYIYVSGSTQDLYFTQNRAGYANTTRLRWLESNLYTGLLTGGVISASLGSTSFSITSGSAIIVTLNASTDSADPYPTVKQVSWNTQTTPLSYSASAKITYIGISNTGQVTQQTVPWGSIDIDQFDTEVEIGVVLHLSGSVVTGVYNTPQVSYGYAQQTDDFVRAFGPIKISGHTLQASGSSPTLSIKKTGGTAYNKGANYVNNPNHPSTVIDPAFNTSKIYRYYISGSTPVIDSGVGGAGYTTIDNTQYVNTTTGNLATVGNGNWSIQRVFWIPNSPTNAFLVYYGNNRYSTLVNAVNAKDSEAFVEAPNTAQNAIFLGYIIIQGGSGRDLLNASETSIIPGGLFRSVGGVGSSGTAPVSNTLAGLSDVAIPSPSVGDLLVYGNGTQWNNNKTLTGDYSLTGSINSTGNITTAGTLTAQTLVVQTITSSIEYSSGSNIFGSQITDTQTMTGSVNITGSLRVTGSSTFNSDVLVGGLTRLLGAGSGNTGYIRLTNNANGSFITFTGTQIRLQDNTTGQLLIGNTNFTVNGISLATAGGAQIAFNQNTSTSGNLIGFVVTSSYSQSSGTAANTDFLVNRTQTIVGSGAQYLIETRTNNVSQFNVSNVGTITTNGSISGSQPTNNPSSSLLLITGSILPNSGSTTGGSAVLLNTVMSASANNQTLVGLDINPTFTNGVFTGVTNNLFRATAANGTYVLISSAGLTIHNPGGSNDWTSTLSVTSQGLTTNSTFVAGGINPGNTITFVGSTHQMSRVGGGSELRVTANGGYLTYYVSGNEAARFAQTSGNLLLGTSTDSGFRLDVSGSTRLNGNTQITGSLGVTGSINVSGGITGSLFGTASYAIYALGGNASSILYQTASSATTWSFNHLLQTQYPVFTIYDANNNVIIPQRIEAIDTSSALIYFSSPSTGIAVASKGGYISSVVSASFASNANSAISASYSETASYLLGYNPGFPFTGSAQITGSLVITGSTSILSGSLSITNPSSGGTSISTNGTISTGNGGFTTSGNGTGTWFGRQLTITSGAPFQVYAYSGNTSWSGSIGLTGSLNIAATGSLIVTSGSLSVTGPTSLSGSLNASGSITFSSLGTGTVSATSGVLSTTSDMSLKIEDGYINNALEKVLKLAPRYFHWKQESGLPTDIRQLGFYAQEVNSALGEEAANTPRTETDKWGIYDRGIIAFLTKAIQEQNQTIASLQDRIAALETKQ